MVIYIAHGAPRFNDQAARAKSGLATPSNTTMILCSMDFNERGEPRTDKGYPSRDACLQDAAAVLVLVPPPKDVPATDLSLGAQLGAYIEICRQRNRPPKIFCLHHPNVDVGDVTALCDSNTVKVVRGEALAVKNLIKELYPGEDRDSVFETTATLLLAAVEAQVPTERHTTASTLTVTVVEGDLPKLAAGELPPDAAIGGDQWEKMFGVEIATAGLTWSEVRKMVDNPEQWEPILAEELDAVRVGHRQRNAVPILLKEETNVPPAAAVVQKYEVYAGNFHNGPGVVQPKLPSVHRFSLVSFRSPMLYDPGDSRLLATAFHLLSVAQLFRFTVLEQDLVALKSHHAGLPHKARIPNFSANVARAVADLRRHMLLVDVESRRRNFLSRLAGFGELMLDSLPTGASDTEKAAAGAAQMRLSAIFNDQWAPVRDRLDVAIRVGEPSLADIVARLEELKRLNAEVLAITARAYAALVLKDHAAG